MAIVAEEERIETLRRWGTSEPLIRLSCGKVLHALFQDCCLGPPWYVYHGGVRYPGPFPLAVLWEWCDRVNGVWWRGNRPEFIRYGFENPEDVEILARTEQGFWATQFDFLYESDTPLEELEQAAALVGYRYLARQVSARMAAETALSTFEGHQRWLREFVESIDADQGLVGDSE